MLLDLAVQGHLVLSQQEIYQLRPDARSRMNAVLMGTVFLGGALASAVSGWLHAAQGWPGVTLFGAALPAVGLLLWLDAQRRRARALG